MPVTIRMPPTIRPLVRLTPQDKIAFLHPGYNAPRNHLFSLPRVDAVNGETDDRRGVHHGTALVACQIVANNSFGKGCLCLDADGQEPAPQDLEGILTASQYYFVIGHSRAEPYPVVPSFQDWEFPHSDFPVGWPAPSDPQVGAISATSAHCVVTSSSLASTSAHLIPKEHGRWFALNAMSIYAINTRDVDDESNLVRMRADIHKCFDDRMFVFAPKTDKDGKQHYVVHAVHEGDTEVRDMYQNTAVQAIGRVSREYLLARFAWCILLRLKPFLVSGVPRRVVQFRIFDGVEPESRTDWLGSSELSEMYGGGKSRSASPRKRKHGIASGETGSGEQEGDCSSTAVGFDAESEDGDVWYAREIDNQGHERGRSRKRVRREQDTVPFLSSLRYKDEID